MISLSNAVVFGWHSAIMGMRNPMNSWAKSDSVFYNDFSCQIGQNDLDLMKTLIKAGAEHRKFLRMIHVQMDIEAPLYWWKEFETYKIGTVSNSCSTMHKIAAKEFTVDDFSHEHLDRFSTEVLGWTIKALNGSREDYMKSKSKDDWWQMIQLLPSSYNQRRTIDLNFEVLLKQYRERKNHKLDEWHIYCDWIKEITLLNEIIKNYGY